MKFIGIASVLSCLALVAAFGCSGPTASDNGESCARTSDCSGDLVCIDNACHAKGYVTPAPGDPPAPTPPRLSAIGESCTETADCADGLICIFTGLAGICDLANYGLTPTGKTCGGECNTAADCCELPIGIVINGIAIYHCEDIVQQVLSANVAQCTLSPVPNSQVGIGCFYYSAYCTAGGCGSNNWACTDNKCIYAGSCNHNPSNELGGCPSQSRTGASLTASCDTTASKCQATVTGCNADADCTDGTFVVDVVGANCRSSDCTCHAKGCYLKCAQDLDCPAKYSCDTATKLCTLNPSCTTDAECVQRTGFLRVDAKCQEGVCGVPCRIDHDCSYSGTLPGLSDSFTGQVCAGGLCKPLGCSTDDECPTTNGTHTLCVTPPAAGTSTIYHSAITN